MRASSRLSPLGMCLLMATCMSAPGAAQGGPETASAAFEPDYRAKSRGTRIVGEAELASLKAPSALVRLGNQKLALMVRDQSGRLRPFYVR